jgi:nuclear polyadenylated RNA-binding protein 3
VAVKIGSITPSMQEPLPELQVTADLSPISPSPLHSASPQVVPTLHDQAATIEAMAKVDAEHAIGGNNIVVSGPNNEGSDEDSFDDAYREEDLNNDAMEIHEEPEASTDDYAKTFDSPDGEVEDEGAEEDISEAPESMNASVPPEAAVTAGSSMASPPADPSLETLSAEGTTSTKSEPAAGDVQSPTIPIQKGSIHKDTRSASPDIQQLVADLTAQATEPSSHASDPSAAAQAENYAQSSDVTSSATSSLPPKPPVLQQVVPSFLTLDYQSPQESSPNATTSAMIVQSAPSQPSTYVAAGAPGTSTEAISSLPPPPATALNAPVAINSLPVPPYISNPPTFLTDKALESEHQKQWDQFVADERRYMSEAKWDRFPDGSRIFIGSRSSAGSATGGAHLFAIGNLSSDRVTKQDVFNLFHKYGRLAQISLKSAYGFVQYHNLEDAQAAMDSLQGVEIRGRKIRECIAPLSPRTPADYFQTWKSPGLRRRRRTVRKPGLLRESAEAETLHKELIGTMVIRIVDLAMTIGPMPIETPPLDEMTIMAEMITTVETGGSTTPRIGLGVDLVPLLLMGDRVMIHTVAEAPAPKTGRVMMLNA